MGDASSILFQENLCLIGRTMMKTVYSKRFVKEKCYKCYNADCASLYKRESTLNNPFLKNLNGCLEKY